MNSGLKPGDELDFFALRTIIVASSPFGADGHNYIYRSVKQDIHLGFRFRGNRSAWLARVGEPD